MYKDTHLHTHAHDYVHIITSIQMLFNLKAATVKQSCNILMGVDKLVTNRLDDGRLGDTGRTFG